MRNRWLLLFLLACGCTKQAAAISPDEAKRLLRITGCTNCHDRERKLIGPAFTLIAERYAGPSTAVEVLQSSLAEGSQGKWGAIPMPPQTRLRPDESRAMIEWILALKPSKP